MYKHNIFQVDLHSFVNAPNVSLKIFEVKNTTEQSEPISSKQLLNAP